MFTLKEGLPLLLSTAALLVSLTTFITSPASHNIGGGGGIGVAEVFGASNGGKRRTLLQNDDDDDDTSVERREEETLTFTLPVVKHRFRGFRKRKEAVDACDLTGQCPAGVAGPQGGEGPLGPQGIPGISGSGRGNFVVTAPPFNAVGDHVADDTAAIQAAIDAAVEVGGRVHIPAGSFLTTAPLVVPSGVSIVGIGAGDDPRNANSVTGSVIKYCGDDYAMIFRSDNSGARDLVIVDSHVEAHCPNAIAKGAILLEANELKPTIESNLFSNLLLFRFVNGTALTLRAVVGGIAYNQFYDIRIRYAKRGIHIAAVGGPGDSFVNSNHFHGGAISGTPSQEFGMDFGILNEGPGPANQNTINAMTIEPGKSMQGHIVVKGASSNIALLGCRLEASRQDTITPIVFISPECGGSIITDTMVGHRHVVADLLRNPGIKVHNGKSMTHSSSIANRLTNPTFHPSNGDSGLEHWEVELNSVTVAAAEQVSSGLLTFAVDPSSDGTSGQNAAGNAAGTSTSSIESNTLFPGFHPLTVTVPAGSTVTFRPLSPLMRPYPVSLAFGVYTKATVVEGEAAPAVSITTTMRGGRSGGMLSSSPQPADGHWHYVGLHAEQLNTVGAQAPIPTVRLDNTAGAAAAEVILTAPGLGYGFGAVAGEAALQTTGGLMAGVLTLAAVPVVLNSCTLQGNDGRLTLPVRGNVFDVSCDACDGDHPECVVSRINSKTGDRFLPGTIITLMLPEPAAGSTVGRVSFRNGGYIDLLRSSGQPTAGRWTLTLLAGSSGTWREVSRATYDNSLR